MQVVAQFSDVLGTVTLFQCEDADAADHLHFLIQISYKGYKEEAEGVVHFNPGTLFTEDNLVTLANAAGEIYAANAKKLYCQAHGTSEITIH